MPEGRPHARHALFDSVGDGAACVNGDHGGPTALPASTTPPPSGVPRISLNHASYLCPYTLPGGHSVLPLGAEGVQPPLPADRLSFSLAMA